jgi:hypothetical protein
MRRAILVAFILLLIPTASAEDSDGDGYDDPTVTYTVWDGADAYPNNPDIHEPVFSSGCDPPVATLDLGEPVTYTCTIANEGPVGLDVLIDAQGDVHLRNLFEGSDHHIGAGDVVTISVTLQGETEGIAMAKVRIFARNGTGPSLTIDLPIQVTGEDWDGMRSHSESNPPDVSGIATCIRAQPAEPSARNASIRSDVGRFQSTISNQRFRKARFTSSRAMR